MTRAMHSADGTPLGWRAAAPVATSHSDMAVMAEAVIHRLHGSDTWDPMALHALAQEPRPDWGPQAAVDFDGCEAAHRELCRVCQDAPTQLDRLHRCAAARMVAVITLHGWDPRWLMHAAPAAAAQPQKAYTLLPHESAVVAATHREYAAAGVVRPCPTPVRGTRASAFVRTTWSLLPAATDRAVAAWVRLQPEGAAACLPGMPERERPTSLFKRKDRVVYDVAALNAVTVAPPFAYPRVEEWAPRLPAGSVAIVMDVAAGYTAIPIATDATHLLVLIAHGSGDVVMLRLPFGYSGAAFVFCFFSGLLGELIANRVPGAIATVYVDDVAVGGHPMRLQDGWEVAVAACFTQLGFKFAATKTQGPASAVDYLGMRVHVGGSHARLELPVARATVLRWQLRSLLWLLGNNSKVPKRTFASVVGKLLALRVLVPNGQQTVAALYSVLKSPQYIQAHMKGLVPVGQRARAALQRLQQQLGGALGHTLQGTSRWSAGWAHCLFATADASGEGGLGCTLAHWAPSHSQHGWFGSLRVPGTQPGEELVGASTLLELYGAAMAVQAARQVVRGTGAILLCLALDSAAAVALLARGYSRNSDELTLACGVVEDTCRQLGVRLAPVWVPRARNWRADLLSHPETACSEAPGVLRGIVKQVDGLRDREEGPASGGDQGSWLPLGNGMWAAGAPAATPPRWLTHLMHAISLRRHQRQRTAGMDKPKALEGGPKGAAGVSSQPRPPE